MLRTLESYFEFARLGTGWRQEIVAGLTTFLTMAYIIFVNPSILAEAGIPCVMFGGDGAGAHAATEWADEASVRALADILAQTAITFSR